MANLRLLFAAAVVLVLLGVGAYLALGAGATPAAPAVPAGPAASGSAGFSPQAPASVWSQDRSGLYTCPGSLVAGYCVLPSASAGAAYCAGDPGCAGYLTYPAGLVPYTGAPLTAVQLTASAPTNATSYGPTTFYQKNPS